LANYRDVIKSLIVTYGKHVIDDAQRFESLLLDHFSDSWRETKLILYGLHVDIAWELRDSPDTAVSMYTVERLSQKLYDEYGVDGELAYWVIEEWAAVFDKTVEQTESESYEDEEIDNATPVETVRSRSPFRTVWWTAVVIAGLIYGALLLRGDIPQPDLSKITGYFQESSETENSRQVSVEISVSAGKQIRNGQEGVIEKNSRFTLTVRDAVTDEKYEVYVYAEDEVAYEEPKDWKWGKKGDPIYKGSYDFYYRTADGSLKSRFLHGNPRFNLNHNMVFISEKNDSVIIVAEYDLTGSAPAYRLYQMLEGEIEYLTKKHGEKFSENMLPEDLIQ